VVIGVVDSILSRRRSEKNEILSLETRQVGLYMGFTNIIQQVIVDYIVFMRQEWEDFEDYMRKYGPSSNPEAYLNFIKVADVFQSLGSMVESGIFDIRTVYNHSGFSIIPLWERMEPLIHGMRKLYNNPTIYPQFEFLYKEMIKYRERVA